MIYLCLLQLDMTYRLRVKFWGYEIAIEIKSAHDQK